METYDFGGYATRNDLLCGDGRTIRKNAFKDDHGQVVPLIWNHDHSTQDAVLGHAMLENRDDGVYAHCKFNDTESGLTAKKLVMNGDLRSLSIYANKLKQIGNDVVHGCIRELSLVLAGANPGAYIDFVVAHGDDEGEEGVYANYDENAITLYHSEEQVLEHAEEKKEDKPMAEEAKKTESATEEVKEEAKSEKTVKEVFDEFTEEQKNVVYAMIGMALEEAGVEVDEDDDDDEEINHSEGGNETMKTNVFDKGNEQENALMHADIFNNAVADGKRFGTLKESVLQHAAANNITDIGELFPKEKDLTAVPSWIKEDDSWVNKVLGGAHHTPFSRVRALFAKMDETEARARGYIKGNEKANLKLAVLKRTTQPTTVYIKMKMDRDDIVDVSFDSIAWIRAEARNQLNRELALGMLLGDSRDPSSDDKIDELCIRPILTDDDMYTIKYTVTDGTDYHNDFNSASENDSEAKGVVRAAVKARKGYKGSGTPTFFTTEDLLTELLLTEDQNGHRLYDSVATLATAMRVKEIVTVPEMEQHTDIYGIIVNMNDYNTGADKGGQVTMFEDFDIDFNQEKYLMETRMSGALVKPYSAIVLKKAGAAG